MFHRVISVIIFAFAVGLVGCRACWGPYDHCQPTFVPEAGDCCMGELYRNGSSLGGMERRCGENGCCGSCSGCPSNISNAVYTESTNGNQSVPANHYESVPENSPLPEAPSSAPLRAEPLPERTNRPVGSGTNLTRTSFPEQFPLADGDGNY